MPAMTSIADTRSNILAAAMGSASLDGFRGMSLGKLAADLGLSKTGIVLPFGNKEGLQLAVMEAAMARFMAAVFAPCLKAPRGLPRLDALMRHWLDWVADADDLPGGCPLIPATREWDDLPGPLRELLGGNYRQWVSTLEEMVRRAERQGDLAPDSDAGLIVFQLYVIILQAQHASRLMQQPDWRQRAERAYAELIDQHRPRH